MDIFFSFNLTKQNRRRRTQRVLKYHLSSYLLLWIRARSRLPKSKQLVKSESAMSQLTTLSNTTKSPLLPYVSEYKGSLLPLIPNSSCVLLNMRSTLQKPELAGHVRASDFCLFWVWAARAHLIWPRRWKPHFRDKVSITCCHDSNCITEFWCSKRYQISTAKVCYGVSLPQVWINNAPVDMLFVEAWLCV